MSHSNVSGVVAARDSPRHAVGEGEAARVRQSDSVVLGVPGPPQSPITERRDREGVWFVGLRELVHATFGRAPTCAQVETIRQVTRRLLLAGPVRSIPLIV